MCCLIRFVHKKILFVLKKPNFAYTNKYAKNILTLKKLLG